MDTWNHLPPVLQALVLGNVIQTTFVVVLRLVRGRLPQVGPLLDRIGPKAVRSEQARRTSAGCGVAIVWFAMSWLVGHEALHVRRLIVAHLTHR